MWKLENNTSRQKYLCHHLFFNLDRKSDVSLDSLDSTRLFGKIFHDYGMGQLVRNGGTFFFLSLPINKYDIIFFDIDVVINIQ